jgi:hypothetical protein
LLITSIGVQRASERVTIAGCLEAGAAAGSSGLLQAEGQLETDENTVSTSIDKRVSMRSEIGEPPRTQVLFFVLVIVQASKCRSGAPEIMHADLYRVCSTVCTYTLSDALL